MNYLDKFEVPLLAQSGQSDISRSFPIVRKSPQAPSSFNSLNLSPP